MITASELSARVQQEKGTKTMGPRISPAAPTISVGLHQYEAERETEIREEISPRPLFEPAGVADGRWV